MAEAALASVDQPAAMVGRRRLIDSGIVQMQQPLESAHNAIQLRHERESAEAIRDEVQVAAASKDGGSCAGFPKLPTKCLLANPQA